MITYKPGERPVYSEVATEWERYANHLERRVDRLLYINDQLHTTLNNVQHGHICPAQTGWLDAGPCNCGLDAAREGHDAAREGHDAAREGQEKQS